ncbi:MAG: hypothetical protein WCJ37_20310 [Syntrophus sp. (in: bacteria)]
MEPEKELRREKVFVPTHLTVSEIKELYDIKRRTASNAKKRGYFVKNYLSKQVIIDRTDFKPGYAYSVAKKVFNKSFARNPYAVNIKEDMVQEAAVRLFELSGKVKENANEKFGEFYGNFWVAHNAMLAYLKTWIRQTQYSVELQDEIHPMMTNGNRKWSPEFGWIYC